MRWNKDAKSGLTARLLGAAALMLSTLLAARLPSAQSLPVVTPPANQPSVPAQPVVPQRTLLIMIDPAHGGGEPGAVLNAAIPEKEVTLAIARRLRQELAARGIQALLLRDSDATISTDQRAQIVNSARPALYVGIHATSQGRGMRIYTAMLPTAGDNSGPFLDWQTAQAQGLARSRWIQEQVAAAIQKTGFPCRSLMAPLRPLNNITMPALAVEIAPTTGDVSQLASADYQQMITAALANSIAVIRGKLEAAP
jgi:N-acetylmuramoyl-L-alanine amidase